MVIDTENKANIMSLEINIKSSIKITNYKIKPKKIKLYSYNSIPLNSHSQTLQANKFFFISI
jgi:hypothetical protein